MNVTVLIGYLNWGFARGDIVLGEGFPEVAVLRGACSSVSDVNLTRILVLGNRSVHLSGCGLLVSRGKEVTVKYNI